MEATIRTFFHSSHYAVVGASTDASKFGHKIFAWYLSHSIPATPINARAPSILDVPTLPSVTALPHPKDTSISFVTPPPVTLYVLREAAERGVRRVWFQPGTWDEECLEAARGMETVVWGHKEELGAEACVLLHGEKGMEGATRSSM